MSTITISRPAVSAANDTANAKLLNDWFANWAPTKLKEIDRPVEQLHGFVAEVFGTPLTAESTPNQFKAARAAKKIVLDWLKQAGAAHDPSGTIAPPRPGKRQPTKPRPATVPPADATIKVVAPSDGTPKALSGTRRTVHVTKPTPTVVVPGNLQSPAAMAKVLEGFTQKYGWRFDELIPSQRKLLSVPVPSDASPELIARYHVNIKPAADFFKANPKEELDMTEPVMSLVDLSTGPVVEPKARKRSGVDPSKVGGMGLRKGRNPRPEITTKATKVNLRIAELTKCLEGLPAHVEKIDEELGESFLAMVTSNLDGNASRKEATTRDHQLDRVFALLPATQAESSVETSETTIESSAPTEAPADATPAPVQTSKATAVTVEQTNDRIMGLRNRLKSNPDVATTFEADFIAKLTFELPDVASLEAIAERNTKLDEVFALLPAHKATSSTKATPATTFRRKGARRTGTVQVAASNRVLLRNSSGYNRDRKPMTPEQLAQSAADLAKKLNQGQKVRATPVNDDKKPKKGGKKQRGE